VSVHPGRPGCAVPCSSSVTTDSLHGIVQHSFALQLSERRRPFDGSENYSRVAERFDCGLFRAWPVSEDSPIAEQADHSPLARGGLTTLGSLHSVYIGPKPREPLPDSFKWADPNGCNGCNSCNKYDEPSLIFADKFDDERRWSINDFLVSEHASPTRREPVSQVLLELLAHKRSRLFGFALANRFVNVLLPHAILRLGNSVLAPAWFMQPLVSFVRGGRERSRLRKTYSLTFFLVPITGDKDFDGRSLPVSEIGQVVNIGWGFAAQPAKEPAKFQVSGELFEYLPAVARRNSLGLGRSPSSPSDELTLREIIERVGFGVGLTLAQGRTGRADLATERFIGNDVIMSLGSARVSSVVVTDPDLKAPDVERLVQGDLAFPKPLLSLMKALSVPIRAAQPSDPEGRKYRLDRPFVDDDIYATAVLPTKRCLVVVSRSDAQCGVRESALMQAGSTAYMTIATATAIGTLREIDKQLEHLEGANPLSVATIDREIAADLNEIYDLDITRESYRRMYQRFRDRLGITRDYETLQDEMNALHRAVTTVHADKAQRLLALLTAAIVVLSVLILIGTLVLIGKPGG
jgi:hypothetical protein